MCVYMHACVRIFRPPPCFHHGCFGGLSPTQHQELTHDYCPMCTKVDQHCWEVNFLNPRKEESQVRHRVRPPVRCGYTAAAAQANLTSQAICSIHCHARGGVINTRACIGYSISCTHQNDQRTMETPVIQPALRFPHRLDPL